MIQMDALTFARFCAEIMKMAREEATGSAPQPSAHIDPAKEKSALEVNRHLYSNEEYERLFTDIMKRLGIAQADQPR